MSSLAAMAEWHSKGNVNYGTAKYLGQTHCDFIDDKTCVSICTVEANGEKGEKTVYRSVASKSSGMLCGISR